MNVTAQVAQKLMLTLQAEPFELTPKRPEELDFKSAAAPADQLSLRNACACACAGIGFRVDDEFDLFPDLLVLDYGLATIGLVHVLDPSAKDLGNQAKEHVDHATFLRH